MNRAEELIADLEAEIVKRDARIAELKREFLKLASMTASTPLVIEQQRGGVVSDLVHHSFSRDRNIKWNAPDEDQAIRATFDEWLKTSQFTRPNSPWDIWKASARLNPTGECVAVPRDTLETALDTMLSILSDDEPLLEEIRALLTRQGKAVG